MDPSDDLIWRMELKPDCRQKQIDKIFLTLIFFFPNCVPMDLDELKKMAEWLEEDHFIEAKSYIDYLDRIYVRVQKMEKRFPPFEFHWMNNQGQQLLSQNDTIVSDGAKRSASMSPALSSMTSLTQTSVPNVVAGLKKKSGIAKKQVSSQELQHHQLMKQNPPTQMSNDVGRRGTKRQSETAHAQELVQQKLQKKQQHQLMNPQQFSSSMNSSNAQTGQNADDWQEEIYDKIQAIKIRYLPSLKDIYQKTFKECEEHLKRNDSVSNVPQSERQKLLDLLEGHMRNLNVSKDSVVPAMKDSLSNYEKQLKHVIESNFPREPVSAQHKIQQPGGHPLSTPPQPQQQQQKVDNQPDATKEIIDVITDSE